jgi:anti-sigma-K factor RskA
MALPDTVVYRLKDDRSEAASPGNAMNRPETKVTVWVNGRTRELFVLLDGVLPSDNRDVQVWGIGGDRPRSFGLVSFDESRGHLYAQYEQGLDPKELSLTMEPKGGSERPTLPESAIIRLAADQ